MTGTPSTKTLEQRRAEHAWEAILSIKNQKGSKEYAGEAKKLPMRIQAAGLGQALAFIVAKAKDQEDKGKKKDQEKKEQEKPGLARLHDDLTDWARKRPLPLKAQESLLESIVQGDAAFLRRATEETLAYLLWLNRFAEAEGLTDTNPQNSTRSDAS